MCSREALLLFFAVNLCRPRLCEKPFQAWLQHFAGALRLVAAVPESVHFELPENLKANTAYLQE